MTLAQIDSVLRYKINMPTEMILLIHVAIKHDYHILKEDLSFSQPVKWHMFEDETHQNRFIRFQIQPCTQLSIRYTATVAYHLIDQDLSHLRELQVKDLPDDILKYLLPSLYCNSDVLMDMAQRTFGHLPPGYWRVKAIEEWIFQHVQYQSGTSNHLTTATDVLVQRAGVCRDFAHLGITLCRALGIPARIVVGYVQIAKFSPDFHAIFEAYLDGQWVLFDATRLTPIQHLVRIATGIDASHVAFATFYGDVELLEIKPLINYEI